MILMLKYTAVFLSSVVELWESYGRYQRAVTFTNTKWTNPYILMLAIPDPWNLSERLWDKGQEMNLLHNCCRELLSTVINCWCIHLWQEEQQKENISLNLELYLFMYTLVLRHNYYLTHWKCTCALLVAWAMCYYWVICYKNAQNIYFEGCIQGCNWCLTDLWHSQNPAREVGRSAWHHTWSVYSLLECWCVHRSR